MDPRDIADPHYTAGIGEEREVPDLVDRLGALAYGDGMEPPLALYDTGLPYIFELGEPLLYGPQEYAVFARR